MAADGGRGAESAGDRAPGVRIGVVGTGHLGRHHVRILASLPGAELVGIHDARPEVARGARRRARHPRLRLGSRSWRAAARRSCWRCPPASTRGSGAGCSAPGCHLLVEKPIASTLDEADALLAAAAAANRVLAVGHVEFFNPAVQALLAHRARAAVPRGPATGRVLAAQPRRGRHPRPDDPRPADPARPRRHARCARSAPPASPCSRRGSTSRTCGSSSARAAWPTSPLRGSPPSVCASCAPSCRRAYLSLDYQTQELKGYRLESGDGGPRIVPLDLPVVPAEPLRRELEAFVGTCQGEETALVGGADGRRGARDGPGRGVGDRYDARLTAAGRQRPARLGAARELRQPLSSRWPARPAVTASGRGGLQLGSRRCPSRKAREETRT